ncbi:MULTISPECIES: TIGR03792 family protein [Synechococcales]|uniref:TIGR03792 family protein n=1 Tax=Synechococcus sp. CS-1333 TaxID=2848638 RepID=UPI00223AFA93|nr:TIGR03792 family protein [Synechococcus sp. CS-1333]
MKGWWLALSLGLALLVAPGLHPAMAHATTGVAGAGARAEAGAFEFLRLRVPAEQRNCWLQAEAVGWGPWLERQQGFAGRELFWNARDTEGVLLIRWRRASDWHGLAETSLAEPQQRFEAEARRCLALPATADNPFALLGSAELLPQP